MTRFSISEEHASVLDAYRQMNEAAKCGKVKSKKKDQKSKKRKSDLSIKPEMYKGYTAYGQNVPHAMDDFTENLIGEEYTLHTYTKAILDVKDFIVKNAPTYEDEQNINKYIKFVDDLRNFLNDKFEYGVNKDHPKV